MPVIFLNFAMAPVSSVPETPTSWTACLVKTTLHTAMRADARHMISSANNSLPQVCIARADRKRFTAT